MADNTKTGMDWQDEELDAIVEDYFAMLRAELSGQPYVKSNHSQALMAQIGRTHGSVEYKHQNISAVLDTMGLPWIPGYKPAKNYQKKIIAAIERYLVRTPAALQPSRVLPLPNSFPDEIFVDPPALSAGGPSMPEALRQLVRKFDPVERDHRNRSLGRAGEEFVIEVEHRRLTNSGRADLARKVRWVAAEDGDGAGYDILSFTLGGREQLLEVKTTNGSARTPFFLTRNERDLANERPGDWRIYRVHLFATERRIFTIAPPLENVLNLSPDTWRAFF
jgi:hypothetical protein